MSTRSVRCPIDLERAAGVEWSRVERPGPLLGGKVGEFHQRVVGHAMIAKPSTESASPREILQPDGQTPGRLIPTL